MPHILPRAHVVIPYGGDCPHRARALAWVRAQYAEQHPGWNVRVAGPPPGPWVKALAVASATADLNPDDIVIVADADVWTDGIGEAVQAVSDGAQWAIPHHGVFRLSEPGTAAMLAGQDPVAHDWDERPYRGIQGGGIVVTTAGALERVPLDPRFEGWGQEDEAWGIALHHTLGPAWRGREELIHLWHPPQPRITRRRGSHAGWRLYRRYNVAAQSEDPGPMTALLEEARDALDAHQPAVHSPAA